MIDSNNKGFNKTVNNNLVWIVNNNKQVAEEYLGMFSEFQTRLIHAESIVERIQGGESPGLIVVSARQSIGESNGFFLIKKIKKVFNINTIPVLMVSADTDPIEEAEALNRGADEYLYEPLSLDLVTAKVTRLMAQFQKIRQAISEGLVTIKSLAVEVDRTLSQCTIAVVDDEIKYREIVEAALQSRFKVRCFDSGVSVSDAVQKGDIDLVLLDIKMPKLDGYEVIQAMQDLNLIEHTPVIFGTGKTRIKQIIKGLDKGAVDYLQKPYVSDVVIARINMQMQRTLMLRLVKRALASKVLEG